MNMKNQTIHELVVNVERSTFTVNPPLDIHQYDTCSHVMLIKLRNDSEFISLGEDITYKMYYYLKQDSTERLIETSDVTVVNAYRGVLSHVVSSAVVKQFGSYTCYLRGYLDEDIISTVSFPIVISKTHDYEAKSNEVIITKEFYDELKAHINNEEIHVSEADRDFLDTFNDQIDELSQVLERNSEIKDYSHESPIKFIDLPEGILNLTEDIILLDKDNEPHVVNSPAIINHRVVSDVHYLSIVASNDVIAYRESTTDFKYNSLMDTTVSIVIDDELSLESENPVQNKVVTKGLYDLIVNDRSKVTDITKIWYNDEESDTVEIYTKSETDTLLDGKAPKSIIVTHREDITNETEVFNDIDNQNRIIEVYTTDEVDAKISEGTSSTLDSAKNYTDTKVGNEATLRSNADNNLQSQIDAITVSSDVRDIVGTYAELEDYDTSHLINGDIVKVLEDETQDDAISYYRWVIPQSGEPYWDYIGSQGPFYTKSETDSTFQEKNLYVTYTKATSGDWGANYSFNTISMALSEGINVIALVRNYTYESLNFDLTMLPTVLDTNWIEFSISVGRFTISLDHSDQNEISLATYHLADSGDLTQKVDKLQGSATSGQILRVNSDGYLALDDNLFIANYTANSGVYTPNNVTFNDIVKAYEQGKSVYATIGSGGGFVFNLIAVDTTEVAFSFVATEPQIGTVVYTLTHNSSNQVSVINKVLQTKLTAGTGITIENDVISSEGVSYTAGQNIEIDGNNVISAGFEVLDLDQYPPEEV